MKTPDDRASRWLEKPSRNRKVRSSKPRNIYMSKTARVWPPEPRPGHPRLIPRVRALAKRPKWKCNQRVYGSDELTAKKMKTHRSESILCGVFMLTETTEEEYGISHSYFAVHFHPSSPRYCTLPTLDGSQRRAAVPIVCATIIMRTLEIFSCSLASHNPSLDCLKGSGIRRQPFILVKKADLRWSQWECIAFA